MIYTISIESSCSEYEVFYQLPWLTKWLPTAYRVAWKFSIDAIESPNVCTVIENLYDLKDTHSDHNVMKSTLGR